MLKEDFVIQSIIRRILVRSNVDYSKITFGTVRGVVYLKGFFEAGGFFKGGGADEIRDFTMQTLRSLEKNIRNISGVVDVNFQFANWKKEKGQWTLRKPKEK